MSNVSTEKRSVWLDVHPSLGVSLMDHLYNNLEGMYPQRWKSCFPSPTSIQNWRESWAEAFTEERITPDEVKRGIAACRKQYDWPPSLSEFLKACRPPIDYEAAYHHAITQMHHRRTGAIDSWKTRAVYWAAASLGGDMQQPYATIKARWKSALDEFVAEEILPEIPAAVPQLPAPGKQTAAPEVVKAATATIKAITSKPRDCMQRWRDIRDKHHAGVVFPPITLEYARAGLEGAREYFYKPSGQIAA